jgi:aldehyde:ferredoxin oxidoreductase
MPLDRKIAYIDLTTGDIQTKAIPLDVRRKFLGAEGWMPIFFTTTPHRDAIPSARTTRSW